MTELKGKVDKSIIISKNDILSTMAYWAIRQSPYDFPKNLEKALTALSEKIDTIWGLSDKKSIDSYKKYTTTDELTNLLKKLVFEIPEIAIWNVTQNEQNEGITNPEDPKRKVKYAFVSRYGGPPADNDFIDLDALRRNVESLIING